MSLVVTGTGKTYGATVALEDVSCRFEPGEVHALLGENGAGKSTLVGVLSGFVRPTAGSAALDGRRLPLGDPLASRRAGVELVHQHSTLAPGLTVDENLEIARMGSVWGLRSNAISERAKALADRLGWASSISQREPKAGTDFYGDEPAERLGVAARQRVEIVKALVGDARVLILDEPTASLAPQEAGELFRVLRRLAGEGRIVILIAHRLAEVRAVADRATVLRAGRVVGTGATADLDDATLARWIVGREPRSERPERGDAGEPVLRLRDVSARADGRGAAIEGVSFEVGREIYGIGGVEGNGQASLAEALAGLIPVSGETTWRGELRAMRSLRCGYVPEDRGRDGIAGGLSIERNLLAASLSGIGASEVVAGGRIREGALREFALRAIARYGVRTSGPGARAGSLSGGNAQKVVVARALESDPDLVVAHNPTRGLDLGARETIHGALREAARTRPVVLLTSDLDELFDLADRTAFLSQGRLREGSDPALMTGWADDGAV